MNESTPLQRALRRTTLAVAALSTALGASSSPLHAQTIRGRLLDAQNGRPIDLGILVLLTLDQDTVTLTASNADGRFSLTAPETGTFLVHASAFGYSPRQEGAFELGSHRVTAIEIRIAPQVIALEEMIVSVDRPRSNHPLIQNGFVRRYQSGFGHFLTPRDLERTVYFNTEAIFRLIPGMRVVTSSGATVGGRSLLGATSERVLMRSPFGAGWCAPAVVIDGVRMQYAP